MCQRTLSPRDRSVSRPLFDNSPVVVYESASCISQPEAGSHQFCGTDIRKPHCGYTTRLVDRLKARETSVVQLWADALAEIPKNQQQVASNPPPELLREIEGILSGRTSNSRGCRFLF